MASSTISKSPNVDGQIIFKGKNKEDGHYTQQYEHPDMDIDLEEDHQKPRIAIFTNGKVAHGEDLRSTVHSGLAI